MRASNTFSCRKHSDARVLRLLTTGPVRAAAAAWAVEHLEDRRLLAAGDPVINEFLASNSTGIVDDYNVRTDWIELYNPTGSTIDLTNWHLTDSKGTPNKW